MRLETRETTLQPAHHAGEQRYITGQEDGTEGEEEPTLYNWQHQTRNPNQEESPA